MKKAVQVDEAAAIVAAGAVAIERTTDVTMRQVLDAADGHLNVDAALRGA